MDIKVPSTEATLNDVNGSTIDQINSSKLAKPLHLQRLEKALCLDSLLKQVESVIGDESQNDTTDETAHIVSLTKQQLRSTKTRVYNLNKIKKSKKWLKNVLLDKSDSSDSDFECESSMSEEDIRDMIRFHNLQKKVKREFDAGTQVSQYHNYSTNLLSTGQSLLTSNSGLGEGTSRTKKKIQSKPIPKRKNVTVLNTPPLVLPPPTSINSNFPLVEVKTEPVKSNEVVSNSAVISSIVNISKPSILPSPPPIVEPKRIKLEGKILDEITYDPTLPDEILQSESSVPGASDPPPSCTPSVTDEIVYCSQLPDEIFETEESSTSVLSQTLSQPTPSVSVPMIALPKCATAPATPTSSCPTSPAQVIIPPKNSKKVSRKKSSATNQEAVNCMKRKRLWIAIARKEIPRAQKQRSTIKKEMLTGCKKMATWCQKEKRKQTVQYDKQFCRDQFSRSRKLTKEMLIYWKHYEKVEKDYRKRAEKQAQEQLKIDIEMMEAKRQQRKLNFLITQTELYAHFMSKKMFDTQQQNDENSHLAILENLEEKPLSFKSSLEITDDYDSETCKGKALKNVENAFKIHEKITAEYDDELNNSEKEVPELISSHLEQPEFFEGLLKSYQLKGMNWLNKLYENGLNGILADEMGLGKTVQTIAFLATLAEKQGIWGPFLIVAPASTLHNWQQEFSKFTPKFKLLPYWGNPNDRKVLRKFWNQKYLHREGASFHILITSYQLIVQDVKYFQRIKWMYMVLDEAQAIKSASSVRWKILLAFQCRNRLLLTGTPIQNTMAELWALLHFIMPTLFDSHDEFSEWFSKDIESHAENKTTIDEKHLSRLHMILKPFMLRRIKKDVENELSDKIEIQLCCGLTQRQKLLYQALKNKISIEDLMQSSYSSVSGQSATSSLMNLVMQFRKVCNHPDLFERRDVSSPSIMKLDTFILPRLLYESGLCYDIFSFNSILYKILNVSMNIFTTDHVHSDIFNSKEPCFSFSRLIGLSPSELRSAFHSNIIMKWKYIILLSSMLAEKQEAYLWNKTERKNDILLVPMKTTYFKNSQNRNDNEIWRPLLFNWDNSYFTYTFSDHILNYNSTGVHQSQDSLLQNVHVGKDAEMSKYSYNRTLRCQETSFPKFLSTACSITSGNKSSASPVDLYCNNMNAMVKQRFLRDGGNPSIYRLLMHGEINNVDNKLDEILRYRKTQFFPPTQKGLIASRPMNGWSPIVIPDKESLVTDSGKLHALDHLLKKLKKEEHRVLIYSQMTRMIDLLEEYMWHRKHKYMRLDGSSKISDRRDMVADFQNRSDIFVFLLSTRAGGLGINLTAADTVIFFDSDWNPTVDQQAMDRAHRLGQTKQVTVYRLICKGTIEERILQRAQEKSEIQRMVISGGSFKPDTLKPTEVVCLLLDDDEMENKFKLRQEEKKQLLEENEVIPKLKRKSRRSEESTPKKKQFKKRKEDPDKEKINMSAFTQEMEYSLDSTPSPSSEQSFNSLLMLQDDDSNEGILIVDDGSGSRSSTGRSPDLSRLTPELNCLQPKRGRSRGRPRGSRSRGPVVARGRNTNTGAHAAEIAGAQAGKNAALAAYASLGGSISGSPTQLNKRGRGRGRIKILNYSIKNQKQNSPSTSSNS